MPKVPIAVKGDRPKSKPFARLLVADEIRIENTGKLFVIGLYADGVVVFRVPRNAPQPSREQPFGLDSLSLLVTIGGFDGAESVRLTLANKKPVEKVVPLRAGGSANIHLPIKPFTFATFGVKELLVEFAGTKHRLQFEVRADYIDPVEDLSAYLAVVTRATTRTLPPPIAEDVAILSKRKTSTPSRQRAKKS